MGVGWVAGSVRAQLLARHRLGLDATREVAAAGSLDAAMRQLGASPYGQVVAGVTSIRDAQRAIWATALWDLRILAGWLPGRGVEAARVFAGFFEIENVEDLLAVDGGDRETPFELGALATAWARAREATSAGELREQLRRSSWRDPGTDDPAGILVSLRLEWARRLSEIEPASAWGLGAAALGVARMLVEHEEPIDPKVVRRVPALGRRVLDAVTLPALVSALPESARWVLEGIERPDDLWRGEARWWQRVDRDGERLLRVARQGLGIAVGAFAVRMTDAWRTAAALDIASRGGRGAEVLDAVA